MFWLNRRSEDPSRTSKICYWKISKLSKAAGDVKYITKNEFEAKRKKSRSKATIQTTDKNGLTIRSADWYKTSVPEMCKQDSTLLRYCHAPKFEFLDLHTLIKRFYESNGIPNADAIIEFCKEKMTIESCEEAVKFTVNQSKCNTWLALRYARITASKFYETLKCKTASGTLTEVHYLR